MIVCHCTNISDTEIRAAIDWMRTADPQAIITPGKVYHALGKSADCGGCIPLFLDTMRESATFEVPNLRPPVTPDASAVSDREYDPCKVIAKSSNT